MSCAALALESAPRAAGLWGLELWSLVFCLWVQVTGAPSLQKFLSVIIGPGLPEKRVCVFGMLRILRLSPTPQEREDFTL